MTPKYNLEVDAFLGQNKFSFCSHTEMAKLARKVDHEGQKEEVQTPSRVVVYKGLELEAGSLHLFPIMMLIFYLLPKNFVAFLALYQMAG